jgi:uncharacterized protein (DUF2249 family)
VVIAGGDRVDRVLARDSRLLEVFASVSPHFERLRSPSMRRVMARLVTVEQAARIAGVDAGVLLERLNDSLLGWSTDPVAGPPHDAEPLKRTEMTTEEMEREIPPLLARIQPERIVDLDVREELRQGREPFSRIMAAKAALPEGHVLRLRAIFEPAPLYQVMAKQGFEHWTEQRAADDWRVWFYRVDEGGKELPAAPRREGGAVGTEEDVVVLDVRGMEPPEPMVRTLAALESLPRGATLVQINSRLPQFLLPKLEELGYRYEVREQDEELVRVFVCRSE